MSELEHCRLAHDGKLTEFMEKIESDPYEDLVNKKDMTGRTAIHWVINSKIYIYNFSMHREFNVNSINVGMCWWQKGNCRLFIQ